MTSIGPQIPEYLLGQRSIDDSGSEGSEEAGPHFETPSKVAMGPRIPDATMPQVREDGQDEEDEEDEYGPSLPPELAAKRPRGSINNAEAGPSGRSRSPAPARRVVGPSMPGPSRVIDESEDDDEYEYGPKPPSEESKGTSNISEGVREFLEREERRKRQIEEAEKPKKLKREEWMLVPPSSSDLLGHLSDPTKLKARQFSRGGSTASRSAPNNLWTETPQERQQRIADEVTGKKRRAANADDDVDDARDSQKRKKRDLELRTIVSEHNKSSRGKSLVEMHQDEKKREKDKKEENEPTAIWDHTRDMSLGGRLMDEKQRGKLISEARSLGDRFGSGKSGGYL